MHARTILQKCFADVFHAMHAARAEVLSLAVQSLLSARRLVLMDLARAWPGAERVRAPLKRLDRLLSNPRLHQERVWLYRALAHRAIQRPDPLIVVDWSVLKPDESWHLLRAAIAVGGRTLTLYEEVHCGRTQQSPAVHRAFLHGLMRVLPAQCRPIIVTDAGFRCPWFREVQALGWHWVGRVRNRVYLKLHDAARWQLSATLLQTRARYTAFHTIQLVRTEPLHCQLLRYQQVARGRKHRTSRGHLSINWESREAARGQREPWLIAYSNSLRDMPIRRIVKLYQSRMQIEQSFRDLKCDRYGCAFNHSLTRKRAPGDPAVTTCSGEFCGLVAGAVDHAASHYCALCGSPKQHPTPLLNTPARLGKPAPPFASASHTVLATREDTEVVAGPPRRYRMNLRGNLSPMGEGEFIFLFSLRG